MRIGIDLMGGDSPPQLFYPAVLSSLKQLKSETVLVVIATKNVVDELSSIVEKTLKNTSSKNTSSKNTSSIEYKIVADAITMDEEPLFAIRKKPNSSLVVGVGLLKTNDLNAFVSCGNTGAIIACATLFLPLLKGISRPALLVQLPTRKRPLVVLDVGGLVSCKAENLVNFAFLGAAYYQAIYGIEKPSVGLLNIGLESKKGNPEVRQAYEQLSHYSEDISLTNESKNNNKLHFAGNVEGREIFNGSLDVLVTDGFTGNVLLKTSEGVASFIFDAIESTFSSNEIFDQKSPMFTEFLTSFKSLKKQFDYHEYDGAIVCGVDGIVIKAHGDSSEKGILSSILKAEELITKNILQSMKTNLD